MTRNAPAKKLGYTFIDNNRHRFQDVRLCPFTHIVGRTSPLYVVDYCDTCSNVPISTSPCCVASMLHSRLKFGKCMCSS